MISNNDKNQTELVQSQDEVDVDNIKKEKEVILIEKITHPTKNSLDWVLDGVLRG